MHVEIQSQVELGFEQRMYQYHYRLYDRYARQVVSMAVLADEQLSWQPNNFGYNLWDCELSFKFPVVKLLKYKEQWELLEQSLNPFAVVTMAYLQALATRNKPEDRFQIKLKLTRLLYQRGYSKQQIFELFRFIDWVLKLLRELEEKISKAIYEIEEAKKMKYITSIERMGIDKGKQLGLIQGLLEGIALDLELRFGKEGVQELPHIRKVTNLDKLRSINRSVKLPEHSRNCVVSIANRMKIASESGFTTNGHELNLYWYISRPQDRNSHRNIFSVFCF